MADPIVQEIKEKIDIAEVIGEIVPLCRAGVNLKGLCPFHNEKTPSFMVSRERGLWRCFGCSEGGDIFAFLQKHEGLSFPEVLKILAEKTGVKLPERREFKKEIYDRETETREELLQINELAARFYHEALLRSKSGEVAREYLKNRGLNDATVKKWQLGFAPDDWHQLETFFVKKGFSKEKLIEAGLLVRGTGGQVYDRFRFRITFPLIDSYGRVVGFTSRTLSTDPKEGKYVNSPETAIYHKGRLLYGFYYAKKAIREKGAAIVVEGNVDVLSSHQAGVENVVASSGTALTSEQLNLISRFTKNLVFAFDTDKAGLTATRRGLELALSQGFNIQIVKLPGAKDPDELIRQDPKLWEQAITTAPNFLDFSFDLLFANIKANDKDKLRGAAKEYLAIVGLINDPIARAQEARRISQKLEVPIETILDYFKNLKKASTGVSGPTPVADRRQTKNRRSLLEERILGISLVNPALHQVLGEVLIPSDFSTVAAAADSVINKKGIAAEQLSYLEFLGEEELNRMKEDYPDEERIEKVFRGLCSQLKELSIKEQMKNLERVIAEKEVQGQAVELEELRTHFNELSNSLSLITRK